MVRVSIIIAAHNEGSALSKTIESCIETAGDLDYEIVVADDASDDGSVYEAERRFPQIRIFRQERRLGASPTKALGARNARGSVFVFLDGHCKPEPNALLRLVQDAEITNNTAIVTPTVASLDVARWVTDHSEAGHGYALDLKSLNCNWLPLDALRGVTLNRTLFHESPALIGCAFAIGRELYDRLWGMDSQMRFWGVEDLDFGLKCWLLGYRVLHDSQAVVGHRFRTDFNNYVVPLQHVVVNQLRMARKNFTQTVWEHWLAGCRQSYQEPLAGHPEGLWAHAWYLFEQDRASVEQERTYLHARRTRDEFWFAERFGLSWPRLSAGTAETAPTLGTAVISSVSPSPKPSSPPPTCKLTGIVPSGVLLIVGTNQRFTAQGTTLNSVQWTAEGSAQPASGTGASFLTRWTTPGVKTVTARCGTTTRSVNVTALTVSGVLTPRDNFAGRSLARFGVGETIDLSFTMTPTGTAIQLGGLRWFIDAGGGTLTGTSGNDGTGVYTAPAAAGAVRLVLKIATGARAGAVVATRAITIVAPTDALMVQQTGTNVQHTQGTWSVGFKGQVFLRPKDVSFSQMQFREGTVAGVGSGFLAGLNGLMHPLGTFIPVGAGDSVNGCQVKGIDTVSGGPLNPPYSVGDFLWPIPWQFSLDSITAFNFTTANHHMTSDATGQAAIAKKGAGPFVKVPSDPTSTF